MTCFFCKGEMKPSTTIHTVQLKNCVVVIKNVPCLKCEQCGEVVLSADTVEKIEHIFADGRKGRGRDHRCELPLTARHARRGCLSKNRTNGKEKHPQKEAKPQTRCRGLGLCHAAILLRSTESC